MVRSLVTRTAAISFRHSRNRRLGRSNRDASSNLFLEELTAAFEVVPRRVLLKGRRYLEPK
jgi:hypothetical protein